MKKILICTTFREFNGYSNDKIQRLFLESLKNQSYKNWELIVTIFKEKNIENTLKELSIPYRCYYDNSDKYKFSLTTVLLNCIASINDEPSIIIWTTCDVIFDNNFFEKIISNYRAYIGGTSHPHLILNSIDNLKDNKDYYYFPDEGIDTIFFDSLIFDDKSNIDIIHKYRFVDWGVFEHFLVAFLKHTSPAMVNLWGISNISKVRNDRSLNNETSTFFTESLKKNWPPFYNYLCDYNLSRKYNSLLYCHKKFKVLNVKKYIEKFSSFYILYYLKQAVPIKIKNYLKKHLIKLK